MPDTVSKEAKDLIVRVRASRNRRHLRNEPTADDATRPNSQLLQKDPAKRLPLTEVARHPWILKYKKKGTSAGGGSATGP